MNRRPNVVLAVVAAVVVVLAVVAAVVAGNRQPPDLDPTTPEGTVQLFVLAVIDGNDEEAVGYLDPELECEAPLPGVYRPGRLSLAVVSSDVDGTSASVVLDVTEYSGSGPLDSYTHREVYELTAEGDRWQITGAPWPVYGCK